MTLVADSTRTWGVIVGRQHSPGSQVIIRLDKTDPITHKAPGWVGTDAYALIDRMHQHQTAALRYTDLLSQAPQTAVVSLQGLPEAVSWMTDQTRP